MEMNSNNEAKTRNEGLNLRNLELNEPLLIKLPPSNPYIKDKDRQTSSANSNEQDTGNKSQESLSPKSAP
jgi:hypothetical protein